MISLYRSIVYNFKNGGISALLQKIIQKGVEVCFYKRYFLVYDFDLTSQKLDSELRKDIFVKKLNFEDLITYHFFKALSYPEATRARFNNNELCYGFFQDSSLAHVAWLTEGYLYLEKHVPLIKEDGCSAVYDCYTLPDYRRKGVYLFVLEELKRISFKMSKKKVLIAVDPGNLPSKSAIEKAGFVFRKKFIFYKVLFFKKMVEI